MTTQTVGATPRTPAQQRVHEFAGDVIGRIHAAMVEHDMTYAEYEQAKQWLIEVGESGEWPLLLDVWFEHVVEQLSEKDRAGSKGTIQGPYYLPGVADLPWQCALPQRDNEPGDVLRFSGQVRDVDGLPLAGAVLDLWHADSLGRYSGFDPDVPDGNLRGRVHTTGEGRFDIRTVVPGPYEIPKDGPCGRLIAAAGWSAWRPAHLHLFVSAPGYQTLTTQLYFADEHYLDNDIASAVKPELVVDLTMESPEEGTRSWWRTEYDFTLDRAAS